MDLIHSAKIKISAIVYNEYYSADLWFWQLSPRSLRSEQEGCPDKTTDTRILTSYSNE